MESRDGQKEMKGVGGCQTTWTMKWLISGPILQSPISSPVSAGNGHNEAVSKDQTDAFFISHSKDEVHAYCIVVQ